MTVNSVPQFVANIDPLRGLTLADGRRLSLRWAEDLREWDQDALAMLQLTIDEAQQLLEAEAVIDVQLQVMRDNRPNAQPYMTYREYHALTATTFHHFARSTSRRRKTACQRCAKLGAKCWQHRGRP